MIDTFPGGQVTGGVRLDGRCDQDVTQSVYDSHPVTLLDESDSAGLVVLAYLAHPGRLLAIKRWPDIGCGF